MEKITADCIETLARESTEFHIMKTTYGKNIMVSCSIKNDKGDKLEIVKHGSLEAAVEEAYLAYSRFTSALPEFRPAIEHRQTFEVPEGHEAVRDSYGRATGETRPAKPEFDPPSDEIPF